MWRVLLGLKRKKHVDDYRSIGVQPDQSIVVDLELQEALYERYARPEMPSAAMLAEKPFARRCWGLVESKKQ